MPLEVFLGSSVDALLARAEVALGMDAVLVSLRRVAGPGGGPCFELVAGDPVTAARLEHGAPAVGDSGRLGVMSPGPGHLARTATPGRPMIVAFVGPTGAGKTTTIAKVMTHPRVFGHRRAGLLCLDTYRVGAVEQARTYAEIARVPLEVVYEAADIAAALRRLADREVILVDTPGRGPRAQRDRDVVHDWLARIGPHETHLVLPAGLQPALARRIVAHHRPCGVSHLLATKLDELPDDWSVFQLATDLGLPMRWLADGQEVPVDLRSAAPRLLALRAAALAGHGTEVVA
ncbi:MAG TPA: hypothetical protein VNK43_01675 [Gemmatimonadales bacterium]|nr:hypothetical protein [Gemmatimonadales bacterium]